MSDLPVLDDIITTEVPLSSCVKPEEATNDSNKEINENNGNIEKKEQNSSSGPVNSEQNVEKETPQLLSLPLEIGDGNNSGEKGTGVEIRMIGVEGGDDGNKGGSCVNKGGSGDSNDRNKGKIEEEKEGKAGVALDKKDVVELEKSVEKMVEKRDNLEGKDEGEVGMKEGEKERGNRDGKSGKNVVEEKKDNIDDDIEIMQVKKGAKPKRPLNNFQTYHESTVTSRSQVRRNKRPKNKIKNNSINYIKKKRIDDEESKESKELNKSINLNIDLSALSPEDQQYTQTYLRFSLEEQKRRKKIHEMKKRINENIRKNYYDVPKINKYSREILSKNNDDFLTRQLKMAEKKRKKEETLKKNLERRKEEEIRKSSVLMRKKNVGDGKKVNVNKTINKLYEWDKKRKAKISANVKKNQEKEISKIQAVPKINNKSRKMIIKNNPHSSIDKTINRLYRDDVIKLREKKKLLKEIYTPSFRPNLDYDTYNKILSRFEESHENRGFVTYNNNNISVVDDSKNVEFGGKNQDLEGVFRSRIMGKMNRGSARSSFNIRNKETEEKEIVRNNSSLEHRMRDAMLKRIRKNKV